MQRQYSQNQIPKKQTARRVGKPVKPTSDPLSDIPMLNTTDFLP